MIPPLRPPSNAPSSSGSTARSRPGAWTATRAHGARRELSPISTSFSQSRPPTAFQESGLESPWSPIVPAIGSGFGGVSSLNRQNARSPSVTSSPPGIASPPGFSLGVSRSQTIASFSDSQQASAAAAAPGLVGGASSSGGSSSRNFRASPSLSQSSYTSPTPTSSSAISGSGQSGSVNKIVTTQLFLLLSTIKNIKKETARWEIEAEKIRKVRLEGLLNLTSDSLLIGCSSSRQTAWKC